MAREINLVPDIKGEMIKALKLRNFIFFISIVVAGASIAVVLVFAMIAGGQQAAVDGKKSVLDSLSAKLNSYTDLNDFLTIKDQLSNLSFISGDKKLLSRAIGILPVLQPKNGDVITISKITINLTDEIPSIYFDAQADAKVEPFIDFTVLESFKKSMDYMRYDYGDYVDKNSNIIPAYCIIEKNADGSMLYDSTKGYYAYWLYNGDGCRPTSNTEDNTNDNYLFEQYEGQTVVRIWRTPQFKDWRATDNMKEDGSISGVAHFESKCITYSMTTKNNEDAWLSTNESCLLVPGGYENGGIISNDASNGRGSNGDLVLRFSATIRIAPEFFNFNNHHMLAIGPTGKYNVTDSYVQIQNMFGEAAVECPEGDDACIENETNRKGKE